MSIKYSIYTEDKQENKLAQIAKQFVSDSFNIRHIDGYYEGTQEYAIVFEFIMGGEIDGAIHYFAESIKELNKQSTVLITKEKIEYEYVY